MSFTPLMLRKFKELIIPSISWGLVLLTISLMLGNGGSLGKGLFDAFVMDYWFLRSLFCCYLIACLVIKGQKWFVWIICCSCLIMTLYKLNVMFLAFMCGYLIRKYSILDNQKFTRWSTILSLAGIFVVLTAFYNPHILKTPNNMLGMIKSGSLSVWSLYFYKTFYRIAVGISGALLVIILFYKYLKNIPEFICNIGQKTMGIYLLQKVLLERLMPQFITYQGGILFDLIISPAIAVTVMIVCFYLILQIEKNNKTRKLLLGK